MCGSRRGGGEQGVQTPPDKSQQYRSGSPEKSQLPSQQSMLGHYRHANETPLNGVLLEGR